ncbi:5842_t:CDS:1, partial [Cetraspora pellucida]
TTVIVKQKFTQILDACSLDVIVAVVGAVAIVETIAVAFDADGFVLTCF